MNVNTLRFDHYIPSKNAYLVKHNDYYIKHGEAKQGIRKIFCNVVYDEFEQKSINELKKAIEENQLKLPENWDDRKTLIYCYNGGFQVEESIKNLKLHLEWQNTKDWQELSDKTVEILKKGVIYTYGFDKCYRPIVFINVYMMDIKVYTADELLNAVCFYMTLVKNHVFIPGTVENWVVILDINNMSLWNLTSYMDIIKKIIKTMSINFTNTLEKQFIYNPPWILKSSWKIIENFINPETAAKISFCSSGDTAKLFEIIDPGQLQEKFGGKLPNLTEFWPPKSTFPYEKPLLKKKSTFLDSNKDESEEKDIFYSIRNFSESHIDNGKTEDINLNVLSELSLISKNKMPLIENHRETALEGRGKTAYCGFCNEKNENSSCLLI